MMRIRNEVTGTVAFVGEDFVPYGDWIVDSPVPKRERVVASRVVSEPGKSSNRKSGKSGSGVKTDGVQNSKEKGE